MGRLALRQANKSRGEKRQDDGERGIVAVIGIITLLCIAVLIVILIIAGLDDVVSNGDPSQSMFSESAEIRPIIERTREKKGAFQERVDEWRDNRKNPTNRDGGNRDSGNQSGRR